MLKKLIRKIIFLYKRPVQYEDMRKKTLYCEIYFYDHEWHTTKKIIGEIDTQQLFSTLNSFIEVKNYESKIISKHDVERIIIYEKQNEIAIAKETLEVNTTLKIES
ncbi:MAG: hypothetical protein ACFFFT_00075 [Candidatus Thorarchaeota archaeon]